MPFFWSEQFDLFLQYVGYAAAWDEVLIHGDPAARVNFYPIRPKISLTNIIEVL
jgi:hypothetical protein